MYPRGTDVLPFRIVVYIVGLVVIVVVVIFTCGRVVVDVVRGSFREQGRTVRGPLVRANDELAEEFVAKAVEVVAVELCGLSFSEVFLCHIDKHSNVNTHVGTTYHIC